MVRGRNAPPTRNSKNGEKTMLLSPVSRARRVTRLQRAGVPGLSEADVASVEAAVFHSQLWAVGLKPVAPICPCFGHKREHSVLERAGLWT